MTRKSVWVAPLAMPVVIAIVLLVAGPTSVAANDQPLAASAEVKIDNFSFGPETLEVQWARPSHGPTVMIFRTRW
jgi:hypothetical protein